MDDGYIEVIAIDNRDLAILHAGATGKSICQCKNAVIKTQKAIPMQVDGEPCLMKPCTVQISLDPNIAAQGKMLSRNENTTCKLKCDCLYAIFKIDILSFIFI